jgi:hypothetical protein
MFLLLIGAIGGVILYNKYVVPSQSNPTQRIADEASSTIQAQPSQQNPLTIGYSQRVDNASQPWYGGDTSFNKQNQSADMGLNTKDIWGGLAIPASNDSGQINY